MFMGLSLLGAAAACSDDPEGPGSGGSDAGSDGRTNGSDATADAPAAIDAGVDAPSATDGATKDAASANDGAASDGTVSDAGVDAPSASDAQASDAADGSASAIDAGADASSSADGGAVDGAATDASASDASDAAADDAGAVGPVVTSPGSIDRVDGDPPQGSCNATTLGSFGIFTRKAVVNGQVVTPPDATFCDSSMSFGKLSYDWSSFDDVRKVTDLVGTPVDATWAGFVTFHDKGAYIGTMSIGLYETASSFVPVCRYKGAQRQEPSRARGAAGAPEVDICSTMAFKAYGVPKVRFIGGAPTGAFYPTGGGAAIPITFIML
jgi:hypothetical protein